MKTKEEILNDAIKNASGGWSMEFDKCLEAMQIFADQETSSLREQLKEKEEEIVDLNEVIEDKRRLTREIDVILFGPNAAKNPSLGDVLKSVEELKNKSESQSTLIESLAGALEKMVKQFPGYKASVILEAQEALTEYNNI